MTICIVLKYSQGLCISHVFSKPLFGSSIVKGIFLIGESWLGYRV